MTAHRVLLLSNPYTPTSLLPYPHLYNDDISLNMTVNTFSALKLWLYTGYISSSSDRVTLLEWAGQYGETSHLVQYCIHFITNVISTANIILLIELALKYKLNDLLNWLEWYMAVNYDTFKRDIKKLPAEVAGTIVKNEWPGPDYKDKHRAWKKSRDEYDAKIAAKANQSSSSNCLLQ